MARQPGHQHHAQTVGQAQWVRHGTQRLHFARNRCRSVSDLALALGRTSGDKRDGLGGQAQTRAPSNQIKSNQIHGLWPTGPEENVLNKCRGNFAPKAKEKFSPELKTAGLDHALEGEEGGGLRREGGWGGVARHWVATQHGPTKPQHPRQRKHTNKNKHIIVVPDKL